MPWQWGVTHKRDDDLDNPYVHKYWGFFDTYDFNQPQKIEIWPLQQGNEYFRSDQNPATIRKHEKEETPT